MFSLYFAVFRFVQIYSVHGKYGNYTCLCLASFLNSDLWKLHLSEIKISLLTCLVTYVGLSFTADYLAGIQLHWYFFAIYTFPEIYY